MIPLPGAVLALGAIGKIGGAIAKKNALKKLKGPDIGAIKSELSPWKNKIDNMQSQSTSLLSEAKGMADPQGQYQTQQTQMLTEQLGDQSQQAAQSQSQMMAQRGMGGGGIAGLLQATQGAQASESLRQGMQGIQQAGFDRSQKVRQQGFTLMNKAMSAEQQYGENMVRAREAKRQFSNQKEMQEAQNNPWSVGGDIAMGIGMGMAGTPGIEDVGWSDLNPFGKG